MAGGKSPTYRGAIKLLNELFARFGILFVSDYRTQFTAKEFKDFSKAFSIVSINTASYHLRSNRQAERFVDTFKRTLRKLKGTESVDDIQQFLSVYRVTPNPSTD